MIKVFQLRVGTTKVPFGQFYGGLHGWQGLPGLYRFATDKSHFIMVPIHAYLIAHPQEGPILVDTGINWQQAHDHGDYYRGVAHYLFDEDEYVLDRSQELPTALGQVGYRTDDVTRVVLTHLHEDHVGGLTYLPGVEVVVSREEWENRDQKLFRFIPSVYGPSLPSSRDVTVVNPASGPYDSFDSSHDLTVDGMVKLLPTPGHTPGHVCVLVTLEDHQLLITGDCLYTLRHLANSDVQAFGTRTWAKNQNQSIARIAQLKRQYPELILLPMHDHTEYQTLHLRPALTKGFLTDEDRTGIHAYEANLFDTNGRLRPDRAPQYIPGDPPGHVGRVSE